jgi:hypothetical protein
VRPFAPKFIAPSTRVLTWTPVRPRVRYCMCGFLPDCSSACHHGSDGTLFR